jgi:hypothetical protein
MYSSRRNGPVTDLHNNHTVSSLMRTTTSSSHYPHHTTTRSKTNLNRTVPFRLSSANQVCINESFIYKSKENFKM